MPRSASENAVEVAPEAGRQRLDAARLDARAWRLWERLIDERGIVIDRRRGEEHPLYPDMIYPYDYGHVPGTAAADRHEVDAFVGGAELGLVGLIALVHEPSGIADPKLLVNLTLDDADVVMAFLDRGDPGPNLTLVWRPPERQS
jgi:inorganic pyrophosphatase